MSLRKVGTAVLDLLFPPRCAWCGAVVARGGACPCGKELAALALPDAAIDMDAEGKVHSHIVAAWACYEYAPPVSDAVVRVKFDEDVAPIEDLGRRMGQKLMACGLEKRFDVLVPAPVSRKTLRQRGYNQSLLLANGIARQCTLPVLGDILVKEKETQPQASLGRADRLSNVQGAYAVRDVAKVAGKRVLLVDDVFTTGSTANECAKTLLEAGAAECGVLCLASTPKRDSE